MNSLEVVLRRIETLRKDLPHEFVEQEETGHTETVTHTAGYTETSGGGYWNDYTTEEYVVDQPRIAHINPPEKREAARQELQQIFDNSEWYSARYAAGITLGANIKDQFDSWIETIKKQRRVSDKSTRKKASQDLKHMYRDLDDISHRRIAGKALDYSDLRIWAHEHPVKATVTGIATAGAISGLVYALVEYFSK